MNIKLIAGFSILMLLPCHNSKAIWGLRLWPFTKPNMVQELTSAIAQLRDHEQSTQQALAAAQATTAPVLLTGVGNAISQLQEFQKNAQQAAIHAQTAVQAAAAPELLKGLEAAVSHVRENEQITQQALTAAKAAAQEVASPGLFKGLDMAARATLNGALFCAAQFIKYPTLGLVVLGVAMYLSPRFRNFSAHWATRLFGVIARRFPNNILVRAINNLNPTAEERAAAQQLLAAELVQSEAFTAERTRLQEALERLHTEHVQLAEQHAAAQADLAEARRRQEEFGGLQKGVVILNEQISALEQLFAARLDGEQGLCTHVTHLGEDFEGFRGQMDIFGKNLVARDQQVVQNVQELLAQRDKYIQEQLARHNGTVAKQVTKANVPVMQELVLARQRQHVLAERITALSSVLQKSAALPQPINMESVQ